MKTILTSVLLAAACNLSAAADLHPSGDNTFQIERRPFGSGTPATAASTGTDTALSIADGLYHVPNYLPGFPTAATIWPRELPVECQSDFETGRPTCSGYQVLPAVGRGEYIFVRPIAKPVPVPAVPSVVVTPPPPPPPTRKKPLG